MPAKYVSAGFFILNLTIFNLFLIISYQNSLMKVLVGSKNPVKINSVKEAFSKYFQNNEVLGINVNSGVSIQPVNEETFNGAQNRITALFKINTEENHNADYFVGIEGGIIQVNNTWFGFGCMCIADKNHRFGYGTSPFFELPDSIIKELLNGKELGDVMDEITGKYNTKQKEGAIGFFTNGIMHRTDLYIPGLVTALIPFLHKEFFFDKSAEN